MFTDPAGKNDMILLPGRNELKHFENLWKTLDPRPIEVLFSVLTIVMAYTLAFPAREAFRHGPQFFLMRHIAPLSIWVGFTALVWAIRCYGLLMSSIRHRRVAAYLGFLLWNLTAISLTISGAVFLQNIFWVLAFFNAVVCVRLTKIKAQIGY